MPGKMRDPAALEGIDGIETLISEIERSDKVDARTAESVRSLSVVLAVARALEVARRDAERANVATLTKGLKRDLRDLSSTVADPKAYCENKCRPTLTNGLIHAGRFHRENPDDMGKYLDKLSTAWADYIHCVITCVYEHTAHPKSPKRPTR